MTCVLDWSVSGGFAAGKINYETESEADREMSRIRLSGETWVCPRAVPTFLYGRGLSIAPDRVNLLGIPLHNLTMSDTVETIETMCDQNKAHKVYFVNPHCANIASMIPSISRSFNTRTSLWLTALA